MPNRSEAIVLVGPMGVGKTTVGKKLAKALKRDFIDTDALIVDEHGAIEDIFSTQGEAVFREFEHRALATAIQGSAIVATGGGAVLLESSRDLLKNATVVYLATDGKHIASRLSHGNRPLIKNGMDDWKRIYESRKAIYQQVADFTVDTTGQPLATTVSEIRAKLGI